MAQSARVSAIEVMKSSIEALEARVAEMKRATDLLAVSAGQPAPYGTIGPVIREMPGEGFTREELPSGDFRLGNGPSFSSDTQD